MLRASSDPWVHISFTSIRQEQLNVKIGSLSWNRSGWKRPLRSASPTIKSMSSPGRPIGKIIDMELFSVVPLLAECPKMRDLIPCEGKEAESTPQAGCYYSSAVLQELR